MKNLYKKLMFTALAGTMLTAGMSAFAVSDGKAIPIKNDVYLEGRQVWCWNADGKQIDFLNYNNTIYVPVRTVGEWTGKTVSYDEASNSILLNGAADKVYRKQTDHLVDLDTWSKQTENGIPVKIRDDIKVVFNGKQQNLKDAAGKEAYPINYNNSNYIPIPSVAEMLGMSLKHPLAGDDRGGAYMRTPLTEEQVAQGKAYVDSLFKTFSYTALKADGVKLPAILETRRNLDVRGVSKDPNAVDNEDSIFRLMARCSYTNPDMSVEVVKQFAQLGIDTINKMTALEKPDLPIFDLYYQDMMNHAKKAIASCEEVLQAVADGKDLKTCAGLMLMSTTKKQSAYDACEWVTLAPYLMEDVLMEE